MKRTLVLLALFGVFSSPLWAEENSVIEGNESVQVESQPQLKPDMDVDEEENENTSLSNDPSGKAPESRNKHNQINRKLIKPIPTNRPPS